MKSAKSLKVRQLAGRREWVGLAALALPTFLLSIDTSVLYLAMPRMSIDLKANSTQQLWIMDIYGFMVAGFLITMGGLGDKIGYRKLLLIGSIVFGLASIIAAYSPNANILIGARALLGIAGATIMPSTLALIRNMFASPKQRSTAISVWMSCFMVGMIVGPLVGGLVLDHFWWGAVFLLGVPVMVLVICTGKILLPEYRHSNSRQLDLPGAFFSLAAILPFIYGLTEFSRNNFQPITIISIIAGLIFGMVFIFRERKISNPLLDLNLFKNSIFRATIIAMLLTAVIMGGIAFFIAQYLQMVMGLSPFHAGLWMIPQAVGMIIGSILIPVISRKIRAGIIIPSGLFVATIGMLVIAWTPSSNGLVFLESGFVIAVIGISPILIMGTGIIIESAPKEKAGAAASISETGNQLGVALGVALLGSAGAFIYHKKIENNIAKGLSKEAWKLAHESIVGATAVASGIDDQHREVFIISAKEAFVNGLHTVALVGTFTFAFLIVFSGIRFRNL